jgi:hypothetical protein
MVLMGGTGVGRARRGAGLGVCLVGSLVLAACGMSPVLGTPAGGSSAAGGTPPATVDGVTAADLGHYVAAVERIRLPVNQLLGQADPILDADHDHAISPTVASQRFGALEEHFASYLLAISALHPADATLRTLNRGYAHTYVLEDSYLSALAAALADGEFDDLPDTQNAQRLAIIEWRTELEELAAALHVRLPGDIEQAGRGEIAPSPSGS